MGLSPAKSTLLNLRFLAESWGHSSGEGSAAFLLETTAVGGGRGGKCERGKGKLREITFLCLHWKHQQPKHRGCEDAAARTWSGQERLQRFIFIQWWPTPKSAELRPVVGLLLQLIFCFVGEFPVTLGRTLRLSASTQPCRLAACPTSITRSSATSASGPLFLLLLPLTECQKQNPGLHLYIEFSEFVQMSKQLSPPGTKLSYFPHNINSSWSLKACVGCGWR